MSIDERSCSQRTPSATEMKSSMELLSDTAMYIPLKFLAERSTIYCEVPEECIGLLKANLDHLSHITNTDINLTHSHLNFARLIVSGRIPDIYTAHLNLMWCIQSDKQKLTGFEGPIAETIAQLTAMQQGYQQSMEAQPQRKRCRSELSRRKPMQTLNPENVPEIVVPET